MMRRHDGRRILEHERAVSEYVGMDFSLFRMPGSSVRRTDREPSRAAIAAYRRKLEELTGAERAAAIRAELSGRLMATLLASLDQKQAASPERQETAPLIREEAVLSNSD